MQTTNNTANNIHNKYTVAYGARLQELDQLWGGFTVEELDATDIFVNGNEPTYTNGTQKKFEKLFAYDTVNDDAHPVLVYLQGDTMVAWYDMELAVGFIA